MKGTLNVFNKKDLNFQRIVNLENQMRNLNFTLASQFLKGRLRIDRSAPATSADVQTPDLLYDVVYTPTYTYILIDNAGALAWRRIAMGAF